MLQVGESFPSPTVFEIYRLTSTSNVKKENICGMCEKGVGTNVDLGEIVPCNGPCSQHFHTACAMVASKDTFKCHHCITG